MPPAHAPTADRFAALYTAAIADILDRRGLVDQTLPPELAPLPAGNAPGGPCLPCRGPAVHRPRLRCGDPTHSRDARHTTPQDCVPRWELTGHGDVTVTIGGVSVAPGDWIVADGDGVVVVPQDLVADVLAEAEEKASVESGIRVAVRAGELPLAAYERFGTF